MDNGRHLILSQSELYELTGRERPKWQARILCELGIPYRLHPVTGRPLVSTKAVEALLSAGVDACGKADAPVVQDEEFSVDIEGIRSRGQTSASQ